MSTDLGALLGLGQLQVAGQQVSHVLALGVSMYVRTYVCTYACS
jgi:hypothetical protein